MCLACASNPIDFLDDLVEVNRLYKKLSDEQVKKWQAKIIREKLDEIDKDGGAHCSVGESIVKDLRTRQYELARSL